MEKFKRYEGELEAKMKQLGAGESWVEWWKDQMQGVHWRMLFPNVFAHEVQPEAVVNNGIEAMWSLLKNTFEMKGLPLARAIQMLDAVDTHFEDLVRATLW